VSAPAATTDPVAAHVAELDRVLRGATKDRRSIVREVREGLHDAAEAYRHAGMDPREAARRAVREFGPVADVAPLYQDELAADQGRRTALLLAAGLPALSMGWDLLWRVGIDWGPERPTLALVKALASVQDTASVAVAATALLLVALTFRRTRSPRGVAAAAAASALAAVVVCGGAAVGMSVANGADTLRMVGSQAVGALAYLVSLTMLVLINRSALRTLRTLRGPRRPRPG
jgi:hypothetical protein